MSARYPLSARLLHWAMAALLLSMICLGAAMVDRWEPWVRAYIAVGALLQGVAFAGTATGFSVTADGALIAEVGRPQRGTFEAQINNRQKHIERIDDWIEIRIVWIV